MELALLLVVMTLLGYGLVVVGHRAGLSSLEALVAIIAWLASVMASANALVRIHVRRRLAERKDRPDAT
jgi:hypothetical protein